jgi:hypothetical protein
VRGERSRWESIQVGHDCRMAHAQTPDDVAKSGRPPPNPGVLLCGCTRCSSINCVTAPRCARGGFGQNRGAYLDMRSPKERGLVTLHSAAGLD